MRIEKIDVAQNGFVLENEYGNLYVAKTLLELAQVAGERVPSDGRTEYRENRSAADLDDVKRLAREGRKIDAIQLLRNCFAPMLGLREAKEIVEHLCG